MQKWMYPENGITCYNQYCIDFEVDPMTSIMVDTKLLETRFTSPNQLC